jgi:hypothetical protein
VERGYSTSSVDHRRRLITALDRWFVQRGISLKDFNENRIEQFLRDRRKQHRVQFADTPTLRCFLDYLRNASLVPSPAKRHDNSPIDQLQVSFTEYLAEERGLKQKTRDQWDVFCQQYDTWEAQYHELARHLTSFDEAAYAECMRKERPSHWSWRSARGWLHQGTYDAQYTLLNRRHWGQRSLASTLLGLPDALFHTVKQAFSHGFFISIMAIVSIWIAGSALSKGKPILVLYFVPVLLLIVSFMGWLLLLLVRGAGGLLGSHLDAPGIPVVMSVAGGGARSAFRIWQHNVAHEISRRIQHIGS